MTVYKNAIYINDTLYGSWDAKLQDDISVRHVCSDKQGQVKDLRGIDIPGVMNLV